ncbi:MAG TPA: hypothetical protein VFZ78_04435, partial [Flavisolibacter sp.]
SSVWRKRAMDFIDSIPDGHYVVVRSNSHPDMAGNTYAQAWKADEALYGIGNSLYHKLYNQGFTDLDSFNRPRSWIFMFRKNASAEFTPLSELSDGIYDAITVDADCASLDTVGYISSPVFGPALEWKQLNWRGNFAEPAVPDQVSVNVIGVTNTGTETVLFNNLTLADQTVDLTSVNAATYPFLKLRMATLDTVNLTPYQLRYWRLTYSPAPEGAIAPNILFQQRDTVDVAEPLDFKIAFRNITTIPFDSLKVKLVITDRNNIQHVLPVQKHRPLPGNDTLHVRFQVDTRTLVGHNTLYVEVNPDFDQPEQYHFNNFAFTNFYVRPDTLNPMLDVTFDNVHILNGDIVSSKPEILVKLKDESKWFMLTDTSRLSIRVKDPSGNMRAYPFDNDTLQFSPAQQPPSTNNTATVNFRPYFEEDGMYELIVTGKDMSGNESGNLEYRVAFEVINKPMISNMLNYPNPFTTSTAFVFTITGSEVPQNIRIQILTVTGKVVREITKDELGPLHIGRNITEFKWDGTDQYGQKLGNGVYIYRVITNLNGKSLDKYKATGDDTDKYFNKGYGKMYLMR